MAAGPPCLCCKSMKPRAVKYMSSDACFPSMNRQPHCEHLVANDQSKCVLLHGRQVEERLTFYDTGAAPRKNVDVMAAVRKELDEAGGAEPKVSKQW